MKLYHGTNIDFTAIDIQKCKPNKDFGRGFYLTDIKKQALNMAVRRCDIENNGTPIPPSPATASRRSNTSSK